jgi:hypothetical protein
LYESLINIEATLEILECMSLIQLLTCKIYSLGTATYTVQSGDACFVIRDRYNDTFSLADL